MEKRSLERKTIILLLALNLIITFVFIVIPKVSASTGCFPDTNGHWAEIYICWMSDNGIAGGYPDGTFRPENPVTRAEMSVMMYKLIGDYETRITDLETLLASVSLENAGQDFVFTGVNVNVKSGSGSTYGPVNGLGNLIVGYNETSSSNGDIRTGSHNFVIGEMHSYTSYGGFVAGHNNFLTGPWSSITGGQGNSAIGDMSSVSGGEGNIASGTFSSISGGRHNEASGYSSSVLGGGGTVADGNEAWAYYSVVVGGSRNVAGSVISGNRLTGENSAVLGGYDNVAGGDFSSVSGGYTNKSLGSYSTVGGGKDDTVTDAYDWIAGDLYESE